MQYRPPITPRGRFPQSNGYPPVDITQFSYSVGESRILLQQVGMLLEKLGDKEYATAIMEYAQEGNQESVDQMIYSVTGGNMPIQTKYTPTGVIFHLPSPTMNNQQAKCCSIQIALQWGK